MESEDIGTRPVGDASVETEPGGRFRLRDMHAPSEFPGCPWKRLRVEQIFRLVDVKRLVGVMPGPFLGDEFAHLFRPEREPAVGGPIAENAAQNLDIPEGPPHGSADEVEPTGESLQPRPDGKAVVLDDQDFIGRKPRVETNIAVGAHGVDVSRRTGAQCRFHLDFDQAGKTVREFRDRRGDGMRNDHGFQGAAMPPSFVDGAFRVRKVSFGRFFGPEKIRQNGNARRSRPFRPEIVPVRSEFLPLPSTENLDVVLVVDDAHGIRFGSTG